MNLTDKQLHTLRHMLGINTPGDKEPKPYRNHYAAEPGNQEMTELKRLGAVVFVGQSKLCDGLNFYECTDAGREAAIRSHKSIRISKKKRIYRRFLSAADAYCDLTFKEFLTSPEFARARKEA